ncbi:hypothetical protein QM797_14775 [Rhodococcus sp. IEGM 1381]|uniref:hypothetical protein n=1 Tax=Rhodococcus sp. IEGM 1381 TaxID=3047085 RepID=UPI0024B7CF87|nr:hypothetical protein [Rhodococcus sp. IEGM 1381]MDI9895987.1 hypothetical protein [Rhodococcus sp. IEGM 1381]
MTTPVADQTTTSRLCGHVFVVRGLLESIACDAVIATSSSFRLRYKWFFVLGVEDGGAHVVQQRVAVSPGVSHRRWSA